MADDDISRLYDFTPNTSAQSGQVDGEFNQIITTLNGKMSRAGVNTVSGNNTFSGNNTHSGTNTFSHATTPILVDKIVERTSAAGVTIDGVILKDAGVTFTDAGELTIATGAITATGSYHTIDTEGDAASDDLDTINGGAAGRILIIQAENDGRTVVVKHNTGNILLASGGDISLDEDDKALILVYSAALSKWCEIGFGAAGTAATQSDQETGSSTSKFVTPGRQQYHDSAAKAWVVFNGTGTVAIRDSYNVSSITDGGTGIYVVNTNSVAGNWCGTGAAGRGSSGTTYAALWGPRNSDGSGSSWQLGTLNSSFALTDFEWINVVLYGDVN